MKCYSVYEVAEEFGGGHLHEHLYCDTFFSSFPNLLQDKFAKSWLL